MEKLLGSGNEKEFINTKRAVINTQAVQSAIVSPVQQHKIRVLSMVITTPAGSVQVRFQSGIAGPFLTGLLALTNGNPHVYPFNPLGWIETNAGDGLVMNKSAAAPNIAGFLQYIEVK